LAISATEIFARHAECFDQDTAAMLKAGESPFAYPQLHYTRTMEESKALNELQGAAVIISASGMCEAGRIKHHLKHNLWRPGAHILFVGYQAEGTLGRRIKDGADHVTILGEEIAVQAHVHAIEGFSAHGDRDDLRYWIGGFKEKPRRVFVTHGEAESRQAWAATLQTEFGISPVLPELGQEFDLLAAEQPVVSQPLARTPQEGELAVVDALWQQARSTLARHLNAKGRKLPREAGRYVNKLAALLQEVQAKLGR
jgi:metallo-beta-lactamase family protein